MNNKKPSKLREYVKYPLVKKTYTALSGTLLGQVITLISIPILSRLLSPDVMGIYSTFIAISTILYVILSESYDQAVSVAKSMQECVALIKYVFIKCCTFVLILTPVAVILSKYISKYLDIKTDFYIIALIPLYAALFAVYMMCYYFYLRWGEIKQNSKLKILMPLCVVVFNVLFGILYRGESSLVISQIFAYIVIILLQIRPVINCIHKNQCGNSIPLRNIVKIYKSYPAKVLPSTLINNIAIQLPAILLTSFFGTTIAGYYSMVNKALNMPTTAVSNAFTDVYKNEAIEYCEKGMPTVGVYKRFLKILSLICIPLFLIIMIISPWAFSFILGSAWKEAGIMASVMVPMYLVKSISLPFAFNLVLYNKFNQNLILQIMLMLTSVFSFLIGGKYSSAWRTAIIPYTVGFVIVYLVYLIYSLYLSKKVQPDYLKEKI